MNDVRSNFGGYCYYFWGILHKLLYWEAPPEVQPLTILYTIFDRKGTSFAYPLLTNGTLLTT